ncbi:MAG: hypothetical protein ACXWQR_05450 [Ktedonobacterales bacterium]
MADEGQRDVAASNGNGAGNVQQSGHDGDGERGGQQEALEALEARETLAALLRDLDALHAYLTQRGRHTYELAQRFLDSARRNTESRAFDERQATMLEYQHYIWHEIAGQVNKLIVTYGGDVVSVEGDEGEHDNKASGDGDEQ